MDYSKSARRHSLLHFARAKLGVKLNRFFQEKAIENLKIAGKLHGENNPNNLEPVHNSARALDGKMRS